MMGSSKPVIEVDVVDNRFKIAFFAFEARVVFAMLEQVFSIALILNYFVAGCQI